MCLHFSALCAQRLRALSAAGRALGLRERVRLALQAALGMSYLHDQCPAVIHFDLKPDNLLLEGEGESSTVKVGCCVCVVGVGVGGHLLRPGWGGRAALSWVGGWAICTARHEAQGTDHKHMTDDWTHTRFLPPAGCRLWPQQAQDPELRYVSRSKRHIAVHGPGARAQPQPSEVPVSKLCEPSALAAEFPLPPAHPIALRLSCWYTGRTM
jgi:serine/threonine protein kinase